MSAVTKPVVLDETGKISNQKIEAMGAKIETIGAKIDADGQAVSAQLQALADQTAQNTVALNRKIDSLVETLVVEIPKIIAAMDQLDIIYYVEN